MDRHFGRRDPAFGLRPRDIADALGRRSRRPLSLSGAQGVGQVDRRSAHPRPGHVTQAGPVAGQGPIEGGGDLGLAVAKDAGLNVAQY